MKIIKKIAGYTVIVVLLFIACVYALFKSCSYFEAYLSFDEKKQEIAINPKIIGKSINIDEMKLDKKGLEYQYYCDSCHYSFKIEKTIYHLDSLPLKEGLKKDKIYEFSILSGDKMSSLYIYIDKEGKGRKYR